MERLIYIHKEAPILKLEPIAAQIMDKNSAPALIEISSPTPAKAEQILFQTIKERKLPEANPISG
jgi:hypothetical protein